MKKIFSILFIGVGLFLFSASIVSAIDPLQITTNTLPSATIGQSYSTQIQASGGTAPYTWTTLSTTYPSGCCVLGLSGTADPSYSNSVTFNTQSGSTVISTYPAGTYSWTIKVTDYNGQTATKTLSLTINSNLQITTTNLPDATVGQSYSYQLQATGGTAPYSWSTISTTFPAGCCILGLQGDTATFNTQTSGVVPDYPGAYSWVFKVTDANGSTATKTVNLTIKSSTAQPILIVSSSFVNFNYTQGGSLPSDSSQTISNNSTSQSLTYTISVPNQPAWLNTTYTTTPLPLAPLQTAGVGVSINPTGLTPGTYTTTISFTGNFSNSPASIAVTLHVTGSTSINSSDSHPVGTLINQDGAIFQVHPSGKVGFPSAALFLSHGHSFEEVVLANSADRNLQFVGSQKFPDGSLVVDGGTVYIIYGGKKYGFTSREIFEAYGHQFRHVIAGNLSEHEFGGLITPNSRHSWGALVNINGAIFLMTPTKKIGIPSMAVFRSHKFSLERIVAANSEDLKAPTDEILGYADGTILNVEGTVYFMEGGMKRPFRSAPAFLNRGYRFSNTIPVSRSEVTNVPDGAAFD